MFLEEYDKTIYQLFLAITLEKLKEYFRNYV